MLSRSDESRRLLPNTEGCEGPEIHGIWLPVHRFAELTEKIPLANFTTRGRQTRVCALNILAQHIGQVTLNSPVRHATLSLGSVGTAHRYVRGPKEVPIRHCALRPNDVLKMLEIANGVMMVT